MTKLALPEFRWREFEMCGENYGVGWSLQLIYYIAINWTARDGQDDRQADPVGRPTGNQTNHAALGCRAEDQ